MMDKDNFKYLQKLELANSTLLISLIKEMDDKGLIDGSKVMSEYNANLNEVVNKLTK